MHENRIHRRRQVIPTDFSGVAVYLIDTEQLCPQKTGSRVSWMEFLSEVRTERTIVDSAPNLKQQVGAAS